jgi:hypothetical protein
MKIEETLWVVGTCGKMETDICVPVSERRTGADSAGQRCHATQSVGGTPGEQEYWFRILGGESQKAMSHTLVIHGGAGTIEKSKMTPELEEQYRKALQTALHAGHIVLSAGGTAMDAVQAAVRVMEDSPLFNAGKGAVFNHDGHVEMDASVMDGQTGKAGGVTTVRRLRSPVDAARLVMDKSPHVLLCGQGPSKCSGEVFDVCMRMRKEFVHLPQHY